MKKIAVLLGIIVLVAIYFAYSGLRSKNVQPGKANPPADASAIQNQQVADREPQTIEIPPDKQQMIGVKTCRGQRYFPLRRRLRTIGRIEFDERKLTTVNVKVEGWVEKLYADYTGKYVKKGEPLAEIYSPELMSTQLEYVNLLDWKKDKPIVSREISNSSGVTGTAPQGR